MSEAAPMDIRHVKNVKKTKKTTHTLTMKRCGFLQQTTVVQNAEDERNHSKTCREIMKWTLEEDCQYRRMANYYRFILEGKSKT